MVLPGDLLEIKIKFESDADELKFSFLKNCNEAVNSGGAPCPQCNTEFGSIEEVNRHIRFECQKPKKMEWDENYRPFVCPNCPKAFKRKAHLNRHLKTEAGQSSWPCPNCSKTFSRKEHLSRHMRTEAGESIWTCPNCPKTFTRKDHLNVHMKAEAAGRPKWNCVRCSQSFKNSSSLKRHMKEDQLCNNHSAPYECFHCLFKTEYKEALTQHIESFHSEVQN